MSAPRLLRTIRFDATDEFVFEQAAGPDEWAVSGAFAFAHLSADDIKGKTRQAFANGFLSLQSFGRATFTCVAEISDQELAEAKVSLASHFVECYGAPDSASAMPAAEEEIAFVHDLVAEVPVNTIFAVHRSFDDDGEFREQFRRIEQRIAGGPIYAKAWETDNGT